MSETTQNVAKILTLMMRMDDDDFDHTLNTLQQIQSKRAEENKKKLYVNTRIRT
tara:strand:- start:465 stop:626 length:162 start_codon:yes stop_codon:yes gene_type:complete